MLPLGFGSHQKRLWSDFFCLFVLVAFPAVPHYVLNGSYNLNGHSCMDEGKQLEREKGEDVRKYVMRQLK